MNRIKLGVIPCYTGTLPPLLKIESVKGTKGIESKAPLEEKTKTPSNELKVEHSLESTMDPVVESVTDRAESTMEDVGEKPLEEEVQLPVKGEEKIEEGSPKDSGKMSEVISMKKILPSVKMKSLRKTSNVYSFVYCEV